MEKKKGGELICKRPETIIEARYSLTKRQNDILDMVFATIENDNKLEYEIDIYKYGQLYNIKDKSNIYRDLKKAVLSFESKGFAITQKISEKKQNRIYFSWFSHIYYLDGESKIIVGLDPMLKELMLSAKKASFYQIKYPLNFHNIYSKRIYYYLKSYENSNKNGTGWRIDNLDELRSKLECPKSYNKFSDFRKYVLTPAYGEINGNSDIKFTYEEIKTGRKVTAIKFYIHSNNNVKDEIATTVDIDPEAQPHETEEEQVQALFKENITKHEAKKIYNAARGDIDLIKEKYEIVQDMNNCKNVVGAILTAIKEEWTFNKGSGKRPGGYSNNYDQRQYNIKELEKKLLGRDTEEEEYEEE